MIETEMLITAVEKYPCLWDIHNKDYHDRDVKVTAWEQVCKDVIHDWETCADKVNKNTDLKKKWTHIRDYYRKDLQKTKNIPTGSDAKKQKRYMYADMLYFLEPMFDKSNSEGNNQNNDLNRSRPKLESETEEEQDDYDIEPSPPVSPVQRRQQKKKEFPSHISNILQQKEKTTEHLYNDEDDDTKFLLSFRNYMKRMNMNQKLDFQLGMLQLVKKTLQVEQLPRQIL